MGELRRLPATLFLMLHLLVGMRPAVPSAAMMNAIHHPPAAAALTAVADPHAGHRVHEAHRVQGRSSSDDGQHAHAPAEVPGHRRAADAPPSHGDSESEHASHHDAGCHGAPCCAPVVPHGQIRAIATRDVSVARRRPLVGAGRVIFADGARRRPPATAPPAGLNA